MKATILASLAATCLVLSSLPVSALDIGVGASGSAGVSLGGSGGSASASAGLDASVSRSAAPAPAGADAGAEARSSLAATLSSDDELSVVIRLIEDAKWSNRSFSALTEVSATVYDVSAWVDAQNEAAFESALTAHAEEIAQLQAAMSANASLSAALEAHNADASGVVTVGVAADGSLAIFTY